MNILDQLYEAGSTGLDLSPGDPLCLEAAKEIERLLDVLTFYADPEIYFAIGFFPDRPCGDFINDFDETHLGYKPGKKARDALEESGEVKRTQTWNEVNTLLALLRDFNTIDLIDNHFQRFDNPAPATLLADQIDRVQHLLDKDSL